LLYFDFIEVLHCIILKISKNKGPRMVLLAVLPQASREQEALQPLEVLLNSNKIFATEIVFRYHRSVQVQF